MFFAGNLRKSSVTGHRSASRRDRPRKNRGVVGPENHRAAVARARRIARLPGDVLGRIKANLNEAELAPERRRWLLAHEATNQIEGAARRMARAATTRDRASG